MLQTYQTTLRSPVTCSGIGLHSGKTVTMSLKPAAEDTGIVFKRTDIDPAKALIPARYDRVVDTRLGTTISNEFGVKISTVEHLMAALWGAGVDNVVIELDAAEVPIMDGSSEPFIFLIECAGLKELKAYRRLVKVLKPIRVKEGEAEAALLPQDGFAIHIEIDFNHAMISRQKALYDFSEQSFKQALSRARTFGFQKDIDKMRSLGLALGGSLDNAIVVGDDHIVNEGGLRFDDEFIRHKALDCIGDLFLAGARIEGKLVCSRPGHSINNTLLRALFADADAWEFTSSRPTSTVSRNTRRDSGLEQIAY